MTLVKSPILLLTMVLIYFPTPNEPISLAAVPHASVYAEIENSVNVVPSVIQLGAVGHGKKYPDLTFDVVNPTDQPQTVSLRPTCGCMKLKSLQSFTIPPGERFTAQFQLSLGRGWGNFSKRIDVLGQNRQLLTSVSVTALFHPGVKLSAMEAVLTTSKSSKLPESSTKVTFISSTKNPQLTELKSEDPRIQFEIVDSPAEGETTLEVHSLSTWPAGRFSSKITGLCNGLPFILPVRGRAFGLLIHEPHSWNLKQVRNSGPIAETMTVSRADGKPLTIESMRVEWLRPVDGFQVTLLQESENDGSIIIKAIATEPVPKVNKGFYGKVILTTGLEEEPQIEIDLLGVIQLPKKN